MGRSRPRSRIGEAIKYVRAQAELKQAELGAAVGIPQPRVSDWEGTVHLEVEEALELLGRMDVACGRPRGSILRRAGFIDHDTTPSDVLGAIEQDPALSDETREIMRRSYLVFRDESAPTAPEPQRVPEAPVTMEEAVAELEDVARRIDLAPRRLGVLKRDARRLLAEDAEEKRRRRKG